MFGIEDYIIAAVAFGLYAFCIANALFGIYRRIFNAAFKKKEGK